MGNPEKKWNSSKINWKIPVIMRSDNAELLQLCTGLFGTLNCTQKERLGEVNGSVAKQRDFELFEAYI